jgi:hypothetical protein
MRVLPPGGTGEIGDVRLPEEADRGEISSPGDDTPAGDPYRRSEACTLIWPFPWTGGGWLSRTSNEATRSKPRD